MGESNDLPTYYSAEVSRPVAEAALHARNAITTALNSNPSLGGGFELEPDGTVGFMWRSNRYDIYLAIATEDEHDVSWSNIPEGYVPEGFDRLEFDITIIGRQPPASYAPGEFSAARDAIKAIIANPPPAGAGRKRHRRKTRKGGKKHHRKTRRHH